MRASWFKNLFLRQILSNPYRKTIIKRITEARNTNLSLAAGRDFWAKNDQKVQHIGTSGDFIFQANNFLSTPMFKTWVLHGR